MAEGQRLRGWRRIAFAVWGAPAADPSMAGWMEVPAGPALDFVERARAAGIHLTLTHLVVKGVGRAIAANPEINVYRRWGRLIPRRSVDVALVVAFDEGRQQAGVTIERADAKAAAAIAAEIEERAARLRGAPIADLGRFALVVDALPVPVLGLLVRFASWLAAVGVDLTRFGMPQYGMRAGGFGSALVSSVGMLGIDHGIPQLTPMSRVPLTVLVGRVVDRAVVVDGRVEARPMFELSVALDHRFVDGWQAAALARSLREYFADPAARD